MPKRVADRDLFDAAMSLVVARGYAGATTKEIARAAGVSEVTLFRKYGSKGELIKRAIAGVMAEMDLEAATRYTGNVRSDLLRMVTAYQSAAQKGGHFFYIMLTEVPRHEELADLLELPMAMIQRFARLLARYQAEGILVREHPLHAVAGLMGPLISTNMIRSAMMESPMPPLDLAAHVDHFLGGHRTGDGPAAGAAEDQRDAAKAARAASSG